MASICEIIAVLIGYAIKTFPVYSFNLKFYIIALHYWQKWTLRYFLMEILIISYILRLGLISVVKHDYGIIRETFRDGSELLEFSSELVQMPSFQPARRQNTVLSQVLCRTLGDEKEDYLVVFKGRSVKFSHVCIASKQGPGRNLAKK